MRNFFVIKALEEEEIETLKYRIISNENFIYNWGLFAEVLGFRLRPDIYIRNLKVTKSGSDYFLSQFDLPTTFGKIKFSNIRFEFYPETLIAGEATSTEVIPNVFVDRVLTNGNPTEPSQYKSIFNTTTYEKTTVSTSHKIGANLSVKTRGLANVGIAKGKIEFGYKFSYDYTFGEQKETYTSHEMNDEIFVTIPPKSKIPFKITNYTNKTTVPFTCLAVMFFNVTMEGTFDRFRTNHKALKKYFRDPEVKPDMIDFKYTFGNDEISAEEQIINESKNDLVWNWDEIMRESSRLYGNFYRGVTNGFAAEFSGQFNSVRVQNVKIEVGKTIELPE